MNTWSNEELRKISEADDLHISPFRQDGVTYGTPTWIWSVAVENVLYVRGYNGQKFLLVSGGSAAEGRADHGRWRDKRSEVRASRRRDE